MDNFDSKLKWAGKLAGTTVTPGVSNLENDETTFLTEIKKLQSQIHMIRSQYRRRFNVIRSSTAALPNEILITIFRLVCSATGPGKGRMGCPQIILGSISGHWRDIVTDMPELWGTFSVKISKENAQSTILLLQVYSARRRRMPSLIQVDLQGLDYSSPQVLQSLTFLERSLLSGDMSELIHVMNVHCPPPHWLFTIINKCSNLHELSLSWTPQNTGIYIWGRRFPTPPPLFNLRILRINRVPIMLCFDLLLGCPNLIEFTCTTPLVHVRNDPDGWMMTARNQKVIFPQLEHLAWTPTRKYWDNYFLQFFRFPSLRHFSWPIWPGQHSKELFDSFVTALPSSLETLEIIVSPEPLIASHRIRKMLKRMPGITQLTLTDIPPFAHSTFLHMLQKPSLLPSLKVFKCIQNVEGEIHQCESWAYHLHGMLQQRKLQGVKNFRYEVVNVEIRWRAEDRELITCLEGDGRFKVEIVCDGSALKF